MGLLFESYLNEDWKLSQFKYVVGLDLSTVSTGIALYDIENKKLLSFKAIRCNAEDKIHIQNCEIQSQIMEWEIKFGINKDNCLFAKEKQPLQYGMKTTVNTLISIAKLHGLVEQYFWGIEFPLLDIAVSTVRKVVLEKSKADKEEVYNFIANKFPEIKESQGDKDISDAIAVCLAAKEGLKKFFGEEIKLLKKEAKKYLSEKKIKVITDKITKIKKGLDS